MKTPKVEPYLFFNGRCEQALAFYESTLGAKRVMLIRFKDSPDTPPPGMIPENWEDKVMHAAIQIGDQVVMLSDGCDPDGGFSGFSLSLTLPDVSTCEKIFAALSQGGKVTMPLGKTFWSPCFGMLTDKFGVGWMITVMNQEA
ncbi:VOC family protein [Oscillatoria laete-virens NRMC-F 0139]|nr:VOC family protein [Oscillatoria laete-virens]MDL5052972.1 VOC family protein [Oscillatoria laete-virens NRMC-F 0139]